MPYVITELCTRDGACVDVCPVSCIHTTPEAPQFYIDPDICIECEQCKIVCPVDAIDLDSELPEEHRPSIEVNARFFRANKEVVGPIPLEVALEIVHSAQRYATEKGIKVSVVVADEAGAPIVVSRMDGANPWTPELALHKAYTAVNFQLPTDQLGPDAKQAGFRSLMIGSRGRIMAAGGGMLIVDRYVILGAVGVAGGQSDGQDIQCCQAGLTVLGGPAH